ncbi:ATP-binding protein [Verrucosispora sp. CWR15]|uniref:ATP-binding protein n=1 Tax=Verrucosispora sioxanthis TaxID=2499994 RepID=A0A6M1KZK2_9ACTN|nr:ATP-binding protein [Verrucosispora sioxanthis]NGM13162.1 ATP-binding protein [Verrucosispora sioxanthis]
MVNASTVQIDVLRGRQAECREIRRLLAASAGGALLLHGEPGSGRSTLLAYAHRHGRDRRLLAATGLPDEATLPYAGFAAAARSGARRRGRAARTAPAGAGPGDGRRRLSRPGPARALPRRARSAHRGRSRRSAAVHHGRPRRGRRSHRPVADPGGPTPAAPARRPAARRRQRQRGGRDTPPPAVAARRTGQSRPAGRSPPGVATTGPGAGRAERPRRRERAGPRRLADSLTPGQWQGAEPLPAAVPADGDLGQAYRGLLCLPGDTAARAAAGRARRHRPNPTRARPTRLTSWIR